MGSRRSQGSQNTQPLFCPKEWPFFSTVENLGFFFFFLGSKLSCFRLFNFCCGSFFLLEPISSTSGCKFFILTAMTRGETDNGEIDPADRSHFQGFFLFFFFYSFKIHFYTISNNAGDSKRPLPRSHQPRVSIFFSSQLYIFLKK